MHRITGLVVAAAAVLLFACTATASARTPTRERDVTPYDGSSSCAQFGYAFSDDFVGVVSVRTTTYYDASGQPITEKHKIMTRETDTNSRTGKILRVKQSFTISTNLDTGVSAYSGQVWMGIGSRSAHLVHDTGRVVFDGDGNLIKLAGPHTVLMGGLEPFCDALS